jgi:hypothetical protein
MALTPEKIDAMRVRDAEAAGRYLLDAEAAVRSLNLSIGVWADSVRATAELRHEPGAEDKVLWADADYSAALDAVREVAAVKERLEAAAKAFTKARGGEN